MALLLPPLAAEKMFEIAGLPITNSYINSTLAVVFFVVLAVAVKVGINKYYKNNSVPRGFLNFFESILDFLIKNIDPVTKDRKKTLKFLPLIGTFFLFILISNWMGLLPGTGSIGIYQLHEGHVALIPLLRPANTDLNMTIAMAVLAVMGSHVLGVFTIGFFKYVNKFIKLGDIWSAVKTMHPMKILIAIIEFFVGLLETISEAAKMLSLSLRLFGNIFAGEVLLTVMAGLLLELIKAHIPVLNGLPMVLALPFMALEILVGLIQAIVFSMLALVYVTMATEEVHTHGETHRSQVHGESTPTI